MPKSYNGIIRNAMLAVAGISLLVAVSACQPDEAPATEGPPPIEEAASEENAPDEPTVEEEVSAVPVDDAGITVNLGAAPVTLDPTAVGALDSAGNDVIVNVFSGLAQINPVTRRVEPALAREWQVSADGLTWTVFIRDDVNWVRGTEAGEVEVVRSIVAADVVAAVQRGCRNDVLSPNVQRLFIIEGCRQLNRLPPEDITPEVIAQTLRARILNDTVIEFTLVEDYGAFASLMAAPVMYPVPADVIEAHGENWTLPENILASGAYTIVPSAEPAELQLIRNAPIGGPGNVQQVTVSFDAAGATLAAVSSGAADFVVVSDQEAIGNSNQVQPVALPVTAFITINHESPVINQAEIKAAFSRGLDRQSIVEQFQATSGQFAMPAYVASPPGSVDGSLYQDVAVPFDAGAAQRAINEAGLNSCLGLPDRTFAVDTSDQSTQLVQSYINNWAANLGCRPEAFTVEPLSQREVLVILQRPPVGVEQPRPGFAMFYWQGEALDAQHWYADIFGCRDPFFRDSYLNSLRECSAADELLLQLYSEDNADVRASLMPQVEAAYFDTLSGEFPVIPVLHYARGVASAPRLDTGIMEGGALQFSYWQVTE